MALRNREAFASAMLKNGWLETTPVAVAYNAGGPRARVVYGTLENLRCGTIGELEDDAGTLVIGDVVQFARDLNALVQQPYLRAYA
jgi:siroheme synthase